MFNITPATTNERKPFSEALSTISHQLCLELKDNESEQHFFAQFYDIYLQLEAKYQGCDEARQKQRDLQQ